MIREAYDSYLHDVENNLISNPKFFWKYVCNKSSNDVISLSMKYNNEHLHNYYKVCEAFSS